METDLTTLEKKLSYTFKDKTLLDSALNRKSHNDLADLKYSVESLSYLGDGIIGFLVADELLELSGGSPTYLSDIRSQLTKNSTFAHIARSLELDKYVNVIISKTDEPEKRKYALHGRLASSLEAIAGAIYLDGGVDSARGFVKNFIMRNMVHSLGQLKFETPAKKLLLKAIWEKYNAIPNYKLIFPVPSSGTNLTVAIYAKDILLARGNGHSKREAISDANENAMKEFGISAW